MSIKNVSNTDAKVEITNISHEILSKLRTDISCLENSKIDLEFSNELIDWATQHISLGTIYIIKPPRDLFNYSNSAIAYLIIEGDTNNKNSKATIRGLYVCSQFRGNRLGSQLLKCCIEQYKRDVFVNIRKGKEHFYELNGFKILTPRGNMPELIRGVRYYNHDNPDNSIQIFHESPIKLFNYSLKYNDYIYVLQYCLNNEDYRKYVIKEIKKGKTVIFDNSAFEYGLNLPSDEVFASNIRELSSFAPDKLKFYFIVNDYLNEKEKTIQSMQNWINTYGNLDCKIIGSIQGKTIQELIDCYKFMSECAVVNKIAITFDSKAYDTTFSDINNKLLRWSKGRQYLIERLVEEGLWNFNKPHHLLGASYINEFSNPLYKKLTIESIDTSNPVVCALHNIRYDEKFGNTSKPSTKLCDLLEADVTENQKEILDYNIKVFKSILRV